MAAANTTIENNASTSGYRWPNEPEDLLIFVPQNLKGSPYEMLLNTLMRVQGVVALLCAEFMGAGEYRPKDQEIVGALWITQSQLQLALELMERLDTKAA